MKKIYTLLLSAVLLSVATATAQVSVSSTSQSAQPEFKDEVKMENVKSDVTPEAQIKAERAAIRKERNTIEFNASLNGSFSHFNNNWQKVNGNSNSLTGIANILFTHNYKKDLFTIDTKVTAKMGYTCKFLEKEDDLTKSQDEWFVSVAPAYRMTDNWNVGGIASLRSQFANGFNDNDKITSQFFAPAYLNLSLGFTYVCPKPKFPVKINLSPLALSATYVASYNVRSFFFNDKFGLDYADYVNHAVTLDQTQKNTPYAYGLTLVNGNQRYEGGSSVQIDFDRTFGKKGIFRYRTTIYSFYGWINEVSQQTGARKEIGFEHIAPTVRWENTIDIKATKYFSTQFYFQMYYNKAQCESLQTQVVLGVGLSYTFKNK